MWGGYKAQRAARQAAAEQRSAAGRSRPAPPVQEGADQPEAGSKGQGESHQLGAAGPAGTEAQGLQQRTLSCQQEGAGGGAAAAAAAALAALQGISGGARLSGGGRGATGGRRGVSNKAHSGRGAEKGSGARRSSSTDRLGTAGDAVVSNTLLA